MKFPEIPSRPKRSRRRVLRLLAATSVAGLAAAAGAAAGGFSKAGTPLYLWRGTALGADASLLLHHPDTTEAARLTVLVLAEIERLEKIYSLNRPDSVLVRLNREGHLDNPPAELVALLSRAATVSQASGGAFDVTVQPLWDLYRTHFSDPASDPAGPPTEALARARSLVDHRGLEIKPDHIRFARPEMAVTLNGIAQGDITDRVAELLSAEGLSHSLIDLGEMRALDGHPEGRPWRVAIKDPFDSAKSVAQVDLTNRAIATSSVTGTRFDTTGRYHHLFDPKSGRSSRGLASASVVSRRAAVADALSTALLAMRQPLPIDPKKFDGAEQIFTTDPNGTVTRWSA